MVIADHETALFQSLGRVTHILYIRGNGEMVTIGHGRSRSARLRQYCLMARPRQLAAGRYVDAANGLSYKPRHLRARAPKSAQIGLLQARWRRQFGEKNLPAEQIGA
jgi:hypothetical protein